MTGNPKPSGKLEARPVSDGNATCADAERRIRELGRTPRSPDGEPGSWFEVLCDNDTRARDLADVIRWDGSNAEVDGCSIMTDTSFANFSLACARVGEPINDVSREAVDRSVSRERSKANPDWWSLQRESPSPGDVYPFNIYERREGDLVLRIVRLDDGRPNVMMFNWGVAFDADDVRIDHRTGVFPDDAILDCGSAEGIEAAKAQAIQAARLLLGDVQRAGASQN